MKKLVIVTYVLRALGFVLVLLMLFGHSIVLNLFPGLEGRSINPIFYTGVAISLSRNRKWRNGAREKSKMPRNVPLVKSPTIRTSDWVVYD